MHQCKCLQTQEYQSLKYLRKKTDLCRKIVIGGVDRRATNQQKKRKLKIDQYERYKNRKVEESEDSATVNTLKNVAGSCDDDDAFEQAPTSTSVGCGEFCDSA